MFQFDLQRFGKAPSVSMVQAPANVQAPTPEQTRLAQLNIQQVEALQPVLNKAVGLATNSLDQQQVAPNYVGLYAPGLAQVQQGNQLVQQTAQGQLNPQFLEAQRASVASAMQPYTTGINQLAQRGVFNSSQMDRYMQQAGQAIAGAQTQAYGQNLAQQSQLANQLQQSALAPTNYSAAAQQASMQAPLSYLSAFTTGYQPQQNMYGQLLNQQTALSAPAINQAVVTQPQSPWGAIGSIAGAKIQFGCFAKGTLVWQDDDLIPIEDIEIGDIVDCCVDREVFGTKVIGTKMAIEDTIIIHTDDGQEIETSLHQPFMRDNGEMVLSGLLKIGDKLMTALDEVTITDIQQGDKQAIVYEIKTKNRFFLVGLNELVAEGWTEEGE